MQPFIKFWVEVSLLHSCFFLSGLAFIWQQHEGDIAVHTILMLRQQTSVWIKKINNIKMKYSKDEQKLTVKMF